MKKPMMIINKLLWRIVKWGKSGEKIASLLFLINRKFGCPNSWYSYKLFWIGKTYQMSELKLNGYCLIDKGNYDYRYFNVAFLENMLANVLYVIANGYYPVINLGNRGVGDNNWDTYFKQPFFGGGERMFGNSITPCDYHVVCDIKRSLFHQTPSSIYNEAELEIWSKVYRDFVVLNDETRKYVESEYLELLEGKRVLGVVCRGTDYNRHPKNHPVQPTVEHTIKFIKEKSLNVEYIYVATEEKRIVDEFEKEFPDKIIVNQRSYYDKAYYETKQGISICNIHFDRENDNYLKGLEYLSSIYLLSKCNALIGGNCGASVAAVFINGRKYEYYKIFDLGLY